MSGSGFSGILNGDAGAAQGKAGTTVQTFAVSLSAGFILFGVQFGAFLIVRNYLWSKRIYQPRAFLVPLKNRVKPPPNNPLRWLWTVFKTPEDPDVLQKAGMDAYFFLRYLTMCLKIFLPAAVIILPILLPLNASDGKYTNTIAGKGYNVTGLDTLAWSNVSPEHTSRYWAHLILAISLIGWVCFLVHQELMHYIFKRQEFLGSPSHRLKASSTTVLITDIPSKLCTLEALAEMYDDFPGGVRRIWIGRNFQPLVDKSETRDKLENLLENAETNMIRKVIKEHRKEPKRQGQKDERPRPSTTANELRTTDESATLPEPEQGSLPPRGEIDGQATPAACESDLQYDLATNAAWTKYLSSKQRSTMRIPRDRHTNVCKIPFIGRFFSTKVDTIYYCRRELARLNKEIEAELEDSEQYPQDRSAFIQFNSQKGAHCACQAVASTLPRLMTQRTVEASPADINWSNIGLTWRDRYLRFLSFHLTFLVLIFIFGLISFFTGILSRVSTLAGSTSWLYWVGTLPKWLLSFIQGTLPPVIQVILLSGPLPIILRAMTNHTKGATTGSQGERSLQLWYFIFLFFELFIIPTISSGLTSVVQELLHNPFGTSVPQILATNLPTAANYYFSFLIVQALSISASSILQTIRLLNYYVIGSVNTPDSMFNKLSWTNRTRIGSNIPWYTTFAAIGLVYSCIAPLILLFMILTFSLFWVVIKNNILYVIRTGNVDGGGLFFPSAINQLFTGLYFMEICLIGLFFLVRDVHGSVVCEAQGIIMVVALLFTICYQIWLVMNFQHLYKYAPVQLEAEAARRDKEYEMQRLTSTVYDSGKANESSLDEKKQPTESHINGNAEPDSKQSTESHINDDAELENKQSIESHINDDAGPEIKQSIDSHINGNAEPEKIENIITDHQRHVKSAKSPSPFRSDPIIGFSPRSKDLQAQQRQDGQAARHILARLNRPLDDGRLAELEDRLAQDEARVGNKLLPRLKDVERQMMNDPISKIVMQHNDKLEDLDANDRDMLISVAFTHPVLRQARPAVWIPQDELGVSDDEVRRTVQLSKDVVIDNRGAFFDRKLKVEVIKPPPDMSEFALVMGEL